MTILSEAESKALLEPFSIPFPQEMLSATAEEASTAAGSIGFPVVMKLCGDSIAHKTERGLVRLNVASAEEAAAAARELLELGRPEDNVTGVITAQQVSGQREFVAGISTDPHFGKVILFGLGGVLTEALNDVTTRPCPISERDANEMLDEIRTANLLGPFRCEDAVNRQALVELLVNLSDFAVANPQINSVDLNPIIISQGQPVAVDALVELVAHNSVSDDNATGDTAQSTPQSHDDAVGVDRLLPRKEHFEAFFNPGGVVVAGASTHPGKFGFVSMHNIQASGYAGKLNATNLSGETVLGVETVTSLKDLQPGDADLLFVCTPKVANLELLRDAAAIGVKAAFLTTAGYGESDEQGKADEVELVALCRELDILLVGPNGQGVVSTPAQLCAQIVAPYPPAGSIGIASQSGNFVSSFMNWSLATGVGVSRAVSAGNAAAVTVGDFLNFYASDEHTNVGLAYIEGITDGAALRSSLESASRTMPVVLVKGGATAGGARAAASHTGALATDDRAIDGLCRQLGIVRAPSPQEAFEAAATFATQPLPAGNRVVVMTTAGGWGVVTADAIFAHPELELMGLPEDLLAEIDTKLPPRWSKNNPVDLAGGETRDTIPEVLQIIAEHPEVDSIIYLGLGIQSNQARMLKNGPHADHPDVERIVAYHERQDARFAQAAADVSIATNKPILTATELAVADPDNAGPRTVRQTGRLCYPSANSAVAALGHLTAYARYRRETESSWKLS